VNQRIRTLFWVCFIAFPVLSGSFSYPWGTNESFDPKKHILLAEKQVLAPNEDILAVPDVWRDRQTGQTYRGDDYSGKRRWQAFWNALMLAILTIAGTCFHIRAIQFCRSGLGVSGGGMTRWLYGGGLPAL